MSMSYISTASATSKAQLLYTAKHSPRRPLLLVGSKAKTAEYNSGLRWSLVGLNCLKLHIDLREPRT